MNRSRQQPLHHGIRNSFQPSALIVGHPGHELKVFGWMWTHRPRVYVITDGSGRHGTSRIASTNRVLMQVGCVPGEIFGTLSDTRLYRAILEGETNLFQDMVDHLAVSFLKHGIESVAGDAAEGFSPTHDLCRALIDAAVTKTQRATGRNMKNLQFSLTEWEAESPEPRHDRHCQHFILDDDLLNAKLGAAEGYRELSYEVQRALAERGREYFRLECLRRAAAEAVIQYGHSKPSYEMWGERRVGRGEYETVIRLREHVLPIMAAIMGYAATSDLETFPSFMIA